MVRATEPIKKDPRLTYYGITKNIYSTKRARLGVNHLYKKKKMVPWKERPGSFLAQLEEFHEPLGHLKHDWSIKQQLY